MSLDPLQQKYPNESHYAYVSNSPLLFKDADGRDKVTTIYLKTSNGTYPLIQKTDYKYFEVEAYERFGGGFNFVKYNVNESYTIDVSKDLTSPIITHQSDVDYDKPTYIGTGEYLGRKTGTYGFFSKVKLPQIMVYGSAASGAESVGSPVDPNSPLYSINFAELSRMMSTAMQGMSVPDLKKIDTKTLPGLADKARKIAADDIKGQFEGKDETPRIDPVRKKVNLGMGEWEYYLKNKDGSLKEAGWISGEKDSSVRGKNGSPDTIYERQYSRPTAPNRTIPKK